VPITVLVTGVYGLIAGAVYRQLQAQPQAYDPRALARRRHPSDRAPEDRELHIPRNKFFLADLTDLDALEAAMQGVDVVVQMAADPRHDAGWESILANNIVGARNVFEAAHRAKVRRVIFASSVMVSWGYQQDEPYKAIAERRFDERAGAELHTVTHEWPVRPTGLYPASKVWGEAMGRYYADIHHLSVVCLRIGWVNAEDTPRAQPGMAPIWCSQRDVAQMVERAIRAPGDLRFDIFYVVSNNRFCWVDIEHARQVLGYIPRDSAEERMSHA
jgi:NAD+ dependent glucose-6-phosphate dehydrogenase